ncbi:DoxX family protein [Streptomyces armeniacus]|uniref:DoxX family protein n=1 Tax=Streptomyces armeniacus TaxID=83291 RepID=A0A345XZ11_9ACTN|nr:DoxX family protein [Streptomyces armeniacus]AXK36877.1 DoxX family protein [Streptomyces armeniacus]
MTSPHATTTAPQPYSPDSGPQPPHATDLGLLLLRIALGLIMAAHGSQKLFGWFDGPGLEGTGQFFTSVGYPAGETMAFVAGVTETFGGLALAVGLLTPLAGAAVLGTMLNALAVKWGDGFFAPAGVEYELLLIAGAAAVTLTGSGRYAADYFVPGLRRHRITHGIGAVILALVTAGVVLLLRD